ncbi:hypothetical protein [Paenibacillus sp. SN-8-1]|uniref:hypothetical protein n=1 Tax=Paenibacillus sp. SN-8-1 TaxID=3435409 RepID=UPI003D9A7E5B
MQYAIQLTDENGNEFLLLEEGKEGYQTFDSFEDADDFNYEFEQSLEDGVTSAVVEFN